jgi:hypothetical protein
MFLCIVAFVGEGLTIHMDWKNMEGFDLKLYLSRFWILNIRFCTWEQIVCYRYDKLVKDHMYVPIGISHIEHWTFFYR